VVIKVVVVVPVTDVIVVTGVVVDEKETVLDVADTVAVDVERTVVVELVVPLSEDVVVELDVTELGTEEEDEALNEGEVDETVRVPLVAAVVVVRLWLAAAPGRNAPRPRARTKTTTTATVAPAAICLLYSDNWGPLLPAVDIVLRFRMVSYIGRRSSLVLCLPPESR
jgi:hypothetical protein